MTNSYNSSIWNGAVGVILAFMRWHWQNFVSAQQNCVTTKCSHKIQIPTINDKDITNTIVCKIVWQLLEIFRWFCFGFCSFTLAQNIQLVPHQMNISLIWSNTKPTNKFKISNCWNSCTNCWVAVRLQDKKKKIKKKNFCVPHFYSLIHFHRSQKRVNRLKNCSQTLAHIAYHVTRLYLQRPLWCTQYAWKFTIPMCVYFL